MTDMNELILSVLDHRWMTSNDISNRLRTMRGVSLSPHDAGMRAGSLAQENIILREGSPGGGDPTMFRLPK